MNIIRHAGAVTHRIWDNMAIIRSFHHTPIICAVGGGRSHKDKPIKADIAATPKRDKSESELAQLEAARKEREIKKKEIKAKQILIQKKRDEQAMKKKEASSKKKREDQDQDEV